MSDPDAAMMAAFDAMFTREAERISRRFAQRMAVEHLEYQRLVDSGDEAGAEAYVAELTLRLKGEP